MLILFIKKEIAYRKIVLKRNMYTIWGCSWSVMMTLTVTCCLFPNITMGHLGAALRMGSGEGRPPILSHVRVSREPQPQRLFKNEGLEGSDPFLQTSQIKSPSYQHKILQFHNNGQTSSGFNYIPLKLITTHHPSTKSMPIYPVASKFGKVGDTRQFVGSQSNLDSFDDDGFNDDDSDSWERYSNRWEPNLLPRPEQPTFTPFIGARALNIPQFFQHLRENIQAIREKSLADSSGSREMSGVGARDAASLLSSSLSASLDGHEGDIDKSSETKDIKIAAPTRRGYSSNSEAQVVEDDMTNRGSRSSDLYTLAGRGSGIANIEDNEVEPDTKELLHFLGHGRKEYPKANNYNPAWLFTNLGLGKRSGGTRSGGKGVASFYNQ